MENEKLIARSTIDENQILQMVRDNYDGYLLDLVCLLEYRGLNDIYKCISGGQNLFFKIYARKDIDKVAIEVEMEIVNHLKLSGLSVAYPLNMKNGQTLLPIEMPEGIRFGVLFSEAEGTPCNNDTLDEQEATKIGHLVARMHTILDTIPKTPGRWTLDERLFLDRSMEILANYSNFNPRIELSFLKKVAEELKHQLQTNGKTWNWGLCHGDIYTGNIHKNTDGNLSIYDFDLCGYGWRAYDISPFLGNFGTGVGAEAVEKRKKRLDSFLRGYKTTGGISDAEIEAVYKIFVPFRRIFNLGYLYEAFHYVWGNKLRNDLIANDTKLLHDWIDYYW